jgi:membrane-bound lytic murein transglycosylase D
MTRYSLPALLLALAACGGHRSPAPSTPVPAQARSGEGHAAEPAPAAGGGALTNSVVIPPAPVLDSTLDVELADERQLVADSVADQAVLEELADARPAAPDSAEEGPLVPGTSRGGGAKALIGASNVTWDIDVESFNSHDRVQYYLDFFQTKGRDRMSIWLGRMPKYEAMIREQLQVQGLPGDLVYLALIESGFSNTAVSRSRAVGMWQFMRPTARYFGLRVDSWVDERRDPYKATIAATRFLADLNRRFGSIYLAAAAYNAGGGRISRSLNRLPDEESEEAEAEAEADTLLTDADFFRLYDTKLLHRETRDYVPKLIAAALIAKEPERYGLRPVTEAGPTSYDSIIVPDMTGLDVIAGLADTTVSAIRELNPQYLRLSTPPGSRSLVRLPEGRGPRTVAAYASLPPSRRVTFHTHVVHSGETVSGIARRYRVSQSDVLRANPKVRARGLRAGQRIVIPTGGAMSAAVAMRVAEPATPTCHRVRRGETLSGLARKYEVTPAELRRWNGLNAKGSVRSGMRLRVVEPAPAARSSAAFAKPVKTKASATPAAKPRTHRVRRGETLTGLAKRYGVSLEALREANGLSGNPKIKAGISLKIPA